MTDGIRRQEFPIAFTCFAGLATLLEQQLERLGFCTEVNDAKSLVTLPIAQFKSVEELYRTALTVSIARSCVRLLCRGKTSDLEGILRLLCKVPFEDLIRSDKSFGVFCERVGKHSFKSPDVGREIGAIIRQRFSEVGKAPPPVQLKNPNQRIVCEVRGEDFYVAIEIEGHLDGRRIVASNHHAPLNPSIAVAMIEFSGFYQHGTILDPMAGSGTILREAARAWCKSPQLKHLIGGDLFDEAYGNLVELNQIKSEWCAVETHLGDARNLDYVTEMSVKLVVTNPPYGVRISRPEIVDDLYRRFARAAQAKGISEVVAITSRKRSWMESMSMASYRHIATLAFDHSGLPVWMMKHALLKGDDTLSD